MGGSALLSERETTVVALTQAYRVCVCTNQASKHQAIARDRGLEVWSSINIATLAMHHRRPDEQRRRHNRRSAAASPESLIP